MLKSLFELYGRENWQMPPAQEEELPHGLIADEV